MSRKNDPMTRPLPKWLNTMLIVGTLATVVVLELKRPLRRNRQDKLTRDVRNATVSLLAAATVSLAEQPVVAPLSLAVHRQRLGLLNIVRLPVWAEVALSVILLDYTLYIWHYLTHKAPLLWRFHKAHHVDIDMDASTALRFHPGELMLSVPWRAAQVRLLGISPLALALWQTLTLMAIMFHHSNLRLPFALERRLCRLIVTPRMHGIHHSMVRDETDSNWSTIFSWPDYLHGTLRLNVPQDKITLGVAGYQHPDKVTLGKVLEMPFRPELPAPKPQREPLSISTSTLAG
ncbi:sterol desaturase family protein [Geomonas sp.]|uniref:sterol desaturase family protein n=1 Tax=Geomonas sp. TaxID=2651584 RepID=UPI002B48CC21|nr:sterol desaturase family protein [Geomonas sp.]HJV33732.1 sterol desaturase family protein [Geomonas sp.]